MPDLCRDRNGTEDSMNAGQTLHHLNYISSRRELKPRVSCMRDKTLPPNYIASPSFGGYSILLAKATLEFNSLVFVCTRCLSQPVLEDKDSFESGKPEFKSHPSHRTMRSAVGGSKFSPQPSTSLPGVGTQVLMQ